MLTTNTCKVNRLFSKRLCNFLHKCNILHNKKMPQIQYKITDYLSHFLLVLCVFLINTLIKLQKTLVASLHNLLLKCTKKFNIITLHEREILGCSITLLF
jgi:hypothetical protein